MNVSYNIDNVTILFVKHLAIADIISQVVVVLPLLTLHAAKHWVLGCTSCYILGVINNYPGLLHIHFILLISAHRLLRCLAPVRSAAVFTKAKAYFTVAFIWVYCAVLPLAIFFTQIEINFITDSCTANTYNVGLSRVIGNITITLWVVYICIPFMLVILSIIVLAFISFKLSGVVWNRNRKIVMTTFMIGGSFCISWSPHIVFSFWRAFNGELSTSSLNRIPQYFHMISLCINPIIYTIVNRNFKKFMKEHARKVSEATTSFSTGPMTGSHSKSETINERIRRWTNFEIIFENAASPFENRESKRFKFASGALQDNVSRRVACTTSPIGELSQPGISVTVHELIDVDT